jgi:hypothetical protein
LVRPAQFVELSFVSSTVYVWSGRGEIVWDGQTWLGVGQFGGLSSIEEGTNVQARGIVLTLSGIDLTLLTGLLTDYRQGLPVLVYLGFFDPTSGALVASPICAWAGRTDQPTLTVSGDAATLSVACENRLVEMNVSVDRRYTAEDQNLDYPGDVGFSFVPSIQAITIYWGKFPSSGSGGGVSGWSQG